MSVNPHGIDDPTNFPTAWSVVTTRRLPQPAAAPHRGVGNGPGFAWDCTGGGHGGRLYMVFTDWNTNYTDDFDIFVIHSDANGASGTWSSRVKVNDDSTHRTQFDPRIAVDQTSGKVAVSWYDRRDDTNNVKTKLYAAVSSDGGGTWSTNICLEGNSSDATRANPNYDDYYDYTGLAYYGGYFYPAWADNSTSTGDNPDCPPHNNPTWQMDIYVARVKY